MKYFVYCFLEHTKRMTKYINSHDGDFLFFTTDEWDRFIEDIQKGCKFYTIAYHEKKKERRIICNEKIMFKHYCVYSENEHATRFFLLSNDDRRKVVKYLREQKFIN